MPDLAATTTMRSLDIVLVTQDDALFLSEPMDYLSRRMPRSFRIKGCVLLQGSSLGSESKVVRLWRLTRTFGLYFVTRNLLRYLENRVSGRSVEGVLACHGIPVVRLKENINHVSSRNVLADFSPDILVNIAGSEVFKSQVINLPRIATLNLHTSKLPEYRGMLPTFWVMLNDEEETGVSVFMVDEGIDTGPVVTQKTIRIGGLSQCQLIRLTKIMGMDAVIEAIERIANDDVPPRTQPEVEGSYYSFPTRADVKSFRDKGKRFF